MMIIQDGTIVSWRDLMKYPIPPENGTWEDTMDIMEELIPVFFYRTKLDTLLMWISKCVEQGILTTVEKMNLQTYLINGYSGM